MSIEDPQLSADSLATDDPCKLFRQCLRTGHGAAWEAFLDRYDGEVRRAIFRACSRRHRMLGSLGWSYGEALQEVYCRILAAGGAPFDGNCERQLWKWLERVADHLICDVWRRHRALKRGAAGHRGIALDVLGQGEVPRAESTPEHLLMVKEGMRTLLQRCTEILRGVAAETVKVLVRRAFLEGCTSREIAHASGGRWTAGDVDVLLSRLRRGMAAQGLELPRRGGAGRQAKWTLCNELVG